MEQQPVYSKPNSSTTETLINAGLVVGGLYFGSKFLNNLLQNNISDNSINDPYISTAVKLYQAGHSGIWGLTEDEEKIIELGLEITNYAKVSQAYRSKYDRDLQADLSKWLSTEEYARFEANVRNTQSGGGSTGSGGGIPTAGFKKGDTVYTKANYKLYSTNKPYSRIGAIVTKSGVKGTLYNNPYTATIGGIQGKWVVIDLGSYIYGIRYAIISLNGIYKK